jgi:hypothetical protein
MVEAHLKTLSEIYRVLGIFGIFRIINPEAADKLASGFFVGKGMRTKTKSSNFWFIGGDVVYDPSLSKVADKFSRDIKTLS